MHARYLYLTIAPLLFSLPLLIFVSSEYSITVQKQSIYASPFLLAVVPAYFLNLFVALILSHLIKYFPFFDGKVKYTRWFEKSKSNLYRLTITSTVDDADDADDKWIDIKNFLTRDPIRDVEYDFGCPPITPFHPQKRGQLLLYRCASLLFILIIHVASSFFIILVMDRRIPESFSYFGAFITAGVAAATFISNQRINTRSKNRMKWIDELREEMSKFFGVVDSAEDSKPKDIILERKESIKTYTHLRRNSHKTNCKEKTIDITYASRFSLMSKLELMLNPSERAHRTLISLMRLALGTDDLRVDRCIFSAIGITTKKIDGHKILKNDEKYIPRHKQYIVSYGPQKITEDELISMIFRLAQIILKKEWERVKNLG